MSRVHLLLRSRQLVAFWVGATRAVVTLPVPRCRSETAHARALRARACDRRGAPESEDQSPAHAAYLASGERPEAHAPIDQNSSCALESQRGPTLLSSK